VFGFMEGIKSIYDISEYSVSSTSLEQIFNNFAKEGEGVNILFVFYTDIIDLKKKKFIEKIVTEKE
jgi:hypothetical protein